MEKAEPGRKPARRSKQDMRQLTQRMLCTRLPEDDSLREELAARGLEPTGAGLLLLGQLNKAAKGDTAAAKFLKEMAEEPAGKEKAEKGKDGAGLDLSALSDRELMDMLGK